MPSTDRLLSELEESRYRFGRAEAVRILQLLRKARAARFDDVASLIRFHEVLLVLRAFPPSAAALHAAVQLLDSFWKRVERLRKMGADMDDFDPLEVSGIAGTVMQDALGFDLARWVVRRLPGKVEIAWDDFDDERAMGAVWPRFIQLLSEDAAVEAEIPWRRWLEAAQGNRSATPMWLIEQFESLDLPAAEKSRLYESLHMPVRWRLENSNISRTRNARPVRNVFFHSDPLLTRKDVSLNTELSRKAPQLASISLKQGKDIIDLIREVMLVRYRELYGTTLGDPRSVMRAELGRGVTIYLWGLPPERRLPLRAYIAGVTLKNGVPINYIEAIGLFEWMEIGFNTFYTYRGGEVAWIFAQVLRCLTTHMGTKCVSMYPYQLGHKNEEAIESGAFWFYRKLGFRPGRADLMDLVEREENKIAADARYKSPARILRRLSEGHAFYELPATEPSAWDRFSTRNIGLRVNRAMANEFAGNLEQFKKTASVRLARILKTRDPAESGSYRGAFHDFALVAWLIPELSTWTDDDKRSLGAIIRAKSGRDEMTYLRLLQKHGLLRRAMLRLGSTR
jgi:hypothetical protein